MGFYYLNSRYYDPYTCRFISPDNIDVISATPMALTDKNLYLYCDNNPVMRRDDGGEFWHIIVGAVVGAAVSAISTAITNVVTGKEWHEGVAVAAVAGGLSGALASTGIGVVGQVVGSAAISAGESFVSQGFENGFDNVDYSEVAFNAVVGGFSGAIGGPGKGSKHLTNLGKQTVHRTFNTTKNKGLKAGLEEVGRAFAYYGKNTVKYYTNFKDGIWVDFCHSIATDFTKKQYSNIFVR